MAFSFTPGQIAPQGSQTPSAPGSVAPGSAIAPVAAPVSDSPFLFIRERGQPISVMACIQIVLIVVSILSVVICATLYSYNVYLTSAVSQKRSELDQKDASFPDYPYDEMRRLSKRAATLDKLLQDYISPRSPLKFLENVVENQVYFDEFLLSKGRTGDFTASFAVLGSNYRTLIQQLAALKLT